MYILFDIGGTNTRVSISTDGETLGEVKKFPTPQDFNEGMKIIEETARDLIKQDGIHGVGGGIREVLDKDKSMLITDPKSSFLPEWVGKPLMQTLEENLKAPVFLENDAIMAALGEATHGAGKGKDIVAFFTLSTGFGGARIVNGKIDAKAVGFEPGDLIVGYTDKPIYLESLISGSALEKKYGKKATDIEDPQVWEFVEKYLGIGLYNAISLWSPNVIVLGGPVTEKISFENLNQNIKNNARKFEEFPEIVPSSLGGEAGLYGALEYLKQRLR